MPYKQREDYEIEDFLTDESFTNFHFQLNAHDELSWRQWLEKHPDKAPLVKQARELIDTLSLSISAGEYNTELKKIKQAITEEVVKPRPYLLEKQVATKIQWRRRSLQFAIGALAVVVGAGIFLFTRQPFSNPLTETANHHSYPINLILSDSTVVTLPPQSALKYPLHFEPSSRNVYLKGEAQFHVKRNEKAPFKVFSGNIVATVLGTVFNFKKSGDSAIVVELLKGKLNVQLNESTNTTRSILLYPNEKVTYMKEAHAFYKGTIELRTTIAFQHNTFREVADKMKNAFGITLVNKSNKTGWRFTGVFQDATAKEVIANICFIKNLNASIKADTVYIK